MNSPVEISNKEWSDVTQQVHENTNEIDYLKKKVDSHDEQIKQINDLQKTLPMAIQESISESLKPLNDKNEKLQEKIVVLENQKYKDGYDAMVKIVWAVLGTGITVFVGYIINNLLL